MTIVGEPRKCHCDDPECKTEWACYTCEDYRLLYFRIHTSSANILNGPVKKGDSATLGVFLDARDVNTLRKMLKDWSRGSSRSHNKQIEEDPDV